MILQHFQSLVQSWIRQTAWKFRSDGYVIRYSLGVSGSGNTRGSGMGDTRAKRIG